MDLTRALAVVDTAAAHASEKVGADDETLEALRWLWRNHPVVRDEVVDLVIQLDWYYPPTRSQMANALRNRIRWLLGVKR